MVQNYPVQNHPVRNQTLKAQREPSPELPCLRISLVTVKKSAYNIALSWSKLSTVDSYKVDFIQKNEKCQL